MEKQATFSVSDSTISKLFGWSLALACFSYPITTVIMIKLGLPTAVINVGIKGVILALFLVVLVLSVYKYRGTISRIFLSLVIFFILYGIRLIVDTRMRSIHMDIYDDNYLYLYFFGLTFIPCLTVMFANKIMDWDFLFHLFIKMIILANVLYIFYFTTEGIGSILEQLAGRAQVAEFSDDLNVVSVINPITVGLFGTFLLIICFSTSSKILKLPWYLRGIPKLGLYAAGTINLLLGASRGPVVALVLVFVAFVVIKGGTNFLRYLKYLLILGVLIIVGLVAYDSIFTDSEIFLFQRFETFFTVSESRANEVRNFQFESAYLDFLASPIIGGRFVTSFDNFYPHNIILEILMALGLIGATLFLTIFWQLFLLFRRMWLTTVSPVILTMFLLGLSQLLIGMTSGAISVTPEFWIFVVLLLSIKVHLQNQQEQTYPANSVN